MHDPVNHPSHYVSHPSGVEAIQITEHMGFCLGNAMKYIWRADLKGNSIEDLEKAIWYVQREVEKRKLANFNAASDKFMAGSAYHKQPKDVLEGQPVPSYFNTHNAAKANAGL